MAFEMPPKVKTQIPPITGWQEQCYYVVEVSVNVGNPIHRVILKVGFLNGGKNRPLSGGYTAIADFGDDNYGSPDDLWYLKAICTIPEMND